MPGLTLKTEQVQRLCGIDRILCQAVLDTLVESGFLAQRPDGTYARSRDTDLTRARPAKATLDGHLLDPTARLRRRAS
jgi:hypothetical protein